MTYHFIGDKVVDAINAGGPAHTDSSGVKYRADPLEGKVGIASDFGKRYLMGRVEPQDQILYQTERYNHRDFAYDFTIKDDGDYVLVLKFSEVYFNSENQKIFDVVLNDDHTVVSELDIYKQVGRAVAHDEIIPFNVKGGKLKVLDEVSDFKGKLSVQFKRGDKDNPKINALYIIKGYTTDVPRLREIEQPEQDEPHDLPEPDDSLDEPPKFASGPKIPDPYQEQDQSQMFLPILIALACFFPVLFCLCKIG